MNTKTAKMNVEYGTIHMVVDMPIGPINPAELLQVWIKAFINYMTTTTNCICSDEVLCSSIGQSNALAALIAGIDERIKDEPTKKFYIEHMTSENWDFEVIKQRRGIEAALINRFGTETFERMKAAFGDEWVDSWV